MSNHKCKDIAKRIAKYLSIFINILVYATCAIYLTEAILQTNLSIIITIIIILILWTSAMLFVAYKIKNEEDEEETSNICNEEFNKDTFITTYTINDFDNSEENNDTKYNIVEPLL